MVACAVNIQGVLGEGTLVQFADHCKVDVIPILEWTEVSVALGDLWLYA